jgi:hypothetical protein
MCTFPYHKTYIIYSVSIYDHYVVTRWHCAIFSYLFIFEPLFNEASQLRTNSYFTMTAMAKPSPNPDGAGPIVRRPMGLLITAGCDTTGN